MARRFTGFFMALFACLKTRQACGIQHNGNVRHNNSPDQYGEI
jgi:hypothetical protein